MIKYIAFLRAINVGGKNLIKMGELKKDLKRWNLKMFVLTSKAVT